ncbi:MAG: helix-turn-helix transcriptional regulator, partial [Chloroflexota bacterium]|nr:helix-turn-helix transcriptional regulator [Chloroflexota bacterium]
RGRGGERHRGRRRRRRRVRGFLKPCLLVALTQGEGHGYSLLDRLGRFGFDGKRLDPSLVYRALRDMEDAGWVESHWDDDSQGPKRRVYQIVPEGETYLTEWVNDLHQARDEINSLLQVYEQKV